MWCPLPWSHVGIKNNGTLRMCSHSQSGSNGNTVLMTNGKILQTDDYSPAVLNCDTLKQVRRDMLSGVWPAQCRRCELDSLSGSQSRNEWETKKHLGVFNDEDARRITEDDGEITEENIITLDLRIGNLCNLRCIMCFPGESTLWYKDYQEIFGNDTFVVDDKTYSVIPPIINEFSWSSDITKIDQLIAAGGQLRKIKFGGGEPIIIKHHHYLLTQLIEKGYAADIELEYSINLTVLPPTLFDMWRDFKLVRICASIDAVGEANDAIRYPSKWQVITDNLRLLDKSAPNIVVFTSTTISILSLEYFADLYIWLEDQRFVKINKTPDNPGVSHLVYNPEWLNINLLSDDEADSIFNVLLIKAGNRKRLVKKINTYREYCRLSHSSDVENQRNTFISMAAKLAQKQNQQWGTIFPVAIKLIDSWAQ